MWLLGSAPAIWLAQIWKDHMNLPSFGVWLRIWWKRFLQTLIPPGPIIPCSTWPWPKMSPPLLQTTCSYYPLQMYFANLLPHLPNWLGTNLPYGTFMTLGATVAQQHIRIALLMSFCTGHPVFPCCHSCLEVLFSIVWWELKTFYKAKILA